MKEDLPARTEIQEALLGVLTVSGGELPDDVAIERTIEALGVPPHLREVAYDAGADRKIPKIVQLVRMARQDLVRKGTMDSGRRGVWELSGTRATGPGADGGEREGTAAPPDEVAGPRRRDAETAVARVDDVGSDRQADRGMGDLIEALQVMGFRVEATGDRRIRVVSPVPGDPTRFRAQPVGDEVLLIEEGSADPLVVPWSRVLSVRGRHLDMPMAPRLLLRALRGETIPDPGRAVERALRIYREILRHAELREAAEEDPGIGIDALFWYLEGRATIDPKVTREELIGTIAFFRSPPVDALREGPGGIEVLLDWKSCSERLIRIGVSLSVAGLTRTD